MRPWLRLAAIGGLAVTISIMPAVAEPAIAVPLPDVSASAQTVRGLKIIANQSQGGSASASTAGRSILLAHLREQNLPPQGGLPSGQTPSSSSPQATGETTGAGASPETTGPQDDWERLPANGESQPSPSATDTGATGPTENIGSDSSSPQPDATATEPAPPAGAQPEAGAVQTPLPSAFPEPSPGVDNQGPPPALDASAVNLTPDLTDQSLEPEIKSAATPALAASLRFTEDGRKQLADSHIDEALRSFARAVSIDPGNPYEYYYMGRAWMAKRNYKQALTFLQHSEIGFASQPLWLGTAISYEGVCYEEMGKLEEALKAYRRALTSSPNNLMARVGFGRLGGTIASDASLIAPPPAMDEAPPPPPGGDIGPPPAEAASPPAATSDPAASPSHRALPPASAPSESLPSD